MARTIALLFTPVLLLFPPSASRRAAAQAVASQPSTPVQLPSSLVQPALDSVARAGSDVDLNRWKGSGAARDEVDGNLASMQKDLQTTLPPLLATADAAPASVSASLPVLLNLDALYSVLLRVAIAARGSAPRAESTALEQAAVVLDGARRSLGDAVLTAAKQAEQRVMDLQAPATQEQQAAPQQTAAAKTPTAAKAKKKPASSAATH